MYRTVCRTLIESLSDGASSDWVPWGQYDWDGMTYFWSGLATRGNVNAK